MKTDSPRPIRLKDYRPSDYLIDNVDLDFKLEPTETLVASRLKMRPNPAVKSPAKSLVLDGENLELVSIKLDGKALSESDYTITADSLRIHAVPQKSFRLDISNKVDPEANTALSGLYRTKGIYCTQCEAEGFRRITYFLDRPDVLATYRTRIEADINEAGTLLSNGNLHEKGTLDGGKRHYRVWKDPHPNKE